MELRGNTQNYACLDSDAFQLISSLKSALADSDTQDALLIRQMSGALCTYLLTNYRQPKPSEQCIALAGWRENRAKELLSQSCTLSMNIAHVAKACCLSRSHFSRTFKKNTGLSPRDWLLQFRLKKAKALLNDSDLLIAEISQECGFADQSHFCRAFTRATGETPRNWRQICRGASLERPPKVSDKLRLSAM